MKPKKILAFETSCDDTAAAIVDETGHIYGEAVFSQVEEHQPFGGVVPEIGSRAHIEQIWHVTKKVFQDAKCIPNDIEAVAATVAPGLLGPLMVGAQFGKGYASALSIPFVGVHHIEGHIFSGHMEEDFIDPPFIALIISGGHTALYLVKADFSIRVIGETLDDAAGEAFDKIGRRLGFSYPAGKAIDEAARVGDRTRFVLPVALAQSDCLNFSFSGLKTKALLLLLKYGPFDEQSLSDFCAGVQEAIARALSKKAIRACKKYGIDGLVVGGGVAANSRVREMLAVASKEASIHLYLPKPRYCTDNAVMIAKVAHIKLKRGKCSSLAVDVRATLAIEQAESLQDEALF